MFMVADDFCYAACLHHVVSLCESGVFSVKLEYYCVILTAVYGFSSGFHSCLFYRMLLRTMIDDMILVMVHSTELFFSVAFYL